MIAPESAAFPFDDGVVLGDLEAFLEDIRRVGFFIGNAWFLIL